MSDLTGVLHQLVDAIHRPSDADPADLHAAVDALDAAPAPDPDAEAEPEAPFGTESEPEGASFPAPADHDDH